MTAQAAFDPLYEFAGGWTTALAERYLPLPEMGRAKYECENGRLVVTPTEGSANSYAEIKLARILAPFAEAAGFLVYGEVNLAFGPGDWIEPDLTILNRSGEGQIWIPADACTMPVEMISRASSVRRDIIDKPAKCAAAGIPYFLHVQLDRRLGHAEVTLSRLDREAAHYVTSGRALAGEKLTVAEPFPLSFDPADLLEP